MTAIGDELERVRAGPSGHSAVSVIPERSVEVEVEMDGRSIHLASLLDALAR